MKPGIEHGILPFFGPKRHFQVYEGEWEEDQPSGYGVWRKPGMGKYLGTWIKGRREGYGICEWEITPAATGVPRYVGEWKAHKRHGYGKFDSGCGPSFQGEWREDRP